MRNYILWNYTEHGNKYPSVDPEKYIVFRDNTYFLWDGYTWVDTKSTTGRINSQALPEDVVYSGDIDALGEIPTIKASLPKVFHIYMNIMDANIEPGVPTGGIYNPSTGLLEGDIISTLSDGSIALWSTTKRWIENAFTWYSIGTFTAGGSIIGSWSQPIPVVIGRDGIDGIDGKDGRDGSDGVNIEFIFTRVADSDAFDALTTPVSDPNVTGYVPTIANGGSTVDWFDHPQGITRELQIEAQCYRRLDSETNKWTNWSGPYKWSLWGETGKDGDGIEYIFRLTTKNEVDANGVLKEQYWPPVTQSQVDAIGEAYQQDEYMPNGWDDDPGHVNETQCYQFVSKRKYKGDVGDEGKWLPFSTPTLWDKYVLADVSGFTAFAFCRSLDDLSEDVCSGGSVQFPWPTQTTQPSGAIRSVTWADSVPSGNGDIWMVSRFFDTEGNTPSVWSHPVLWKDNENMQIEYSNDYPWDTMPALLSLNNYVDITKEDGINETLWRQDCTAAGLGTWSDDIIAPKYMAVCYRKGGIWEDWTISKIAGENGTSYRTFTIYKSYESARDVPTRPTGGHWDTVNNTLINIPSGWLLEAPDTSEGNLYVWQSSAQFEGNNGNIVGRWGLPQRLNAIDIKVKSNITYYKKSDQSSDVTAPNVDIDPTLEPYNWTTNPNASAAIIDQDYPYLWMFQRVTYSDDTVYQSSPVIIRYFNDAVDIEAIAAEVSADIDEDLAELRTRLNKITDLNVAQTDITQVQGLYQILTQYRNAQQKSFADLLIDGEESKIRQFAGSEVDGIINGVSSTLNGLEGFARTMVTKVDTDGTVSAAIINATAEAITQTVSKSYDAWKIEYEEDGETIIVYKPKLKEYVTEEVWYPWHADATYDEVVHLDELSAIKQSSDSIIAAVTDGQGHVSASIAIIGGANVSGGKIQLSANEIELNGNVIANAINSSSVIAANGDIIMDSNGLLATNAKILGELYANTGFFGSYTIDPDTHVVTTSTGVAIDANGLHSSNFTSSGTGAGFELGGQGFTFYGPNGTVIANDQVSIVGAITATSGSIGGVNISSNSISSSNGNFNLTSSGSLTVSDITLTGGTISGTLSIGAGILYGYDNPNRFTISATGLQFTNSYNGDPSNQTKGVLIGIDSGISSTYKHTGNSGTDTYTANMSGSILTLTHVTGARASYEDYTGSYNTGGVTLQTIYDDTGITFTTPTANMEAVFGVSSGVKYIVESSQSDYNNSSKHYRTLYLITS